MDLLKPHDFEFITPDWKELNVTNFPVIKDDAPRVLGYGKRDYQVQCYDMFKGERNTIYIAPTGSGKSIVQIFNAAREIIDTDYKQHQVFVVPQLNIGHGFTQYRHKKLEIDGEIYKWKISTNCCYDSENPVGEIKEFLLNPHSCNSFRGQNKLGGCTAAVSYSALLAAFNSMSDEEKEKAIHNVSFRIDEVHHVSGVDEEEGVTNQLGNFCKYVLDNDGSLHLTTATFFRGDNNSILSSSYTDEFKVFNVQFMQHWETLQMESLSQHFCPYKNADHVMDQILETARSEPDEPPMIIVPSDNQKFFKDDIDKWEWVKNLVEKLEGIYGEGQVLDLVSPDKQAKDKKRLVSENKEFFAVVTCAIGKEGTDWPACSRVHNTVTDGNTLQVIQKLGRALRQYEGKYNVKMYNYIEHFEDWDDDPDKIRRIVSDRFNAMLAASMLDDMFMPLLMETFPKTVGEEKVSKMVSLEDVFGEQRNELVDSLLREYLSIPEELRTPEEQDRIIDKIINEYSDCMLEEVDDDILKDRLRKELIRRTNEPKEKVLKRLLSVEFIREEGGWDKVSREHVGSPFVGAATTKNLEELQKFLKGDVMEVINYIKEVGIENVPKDSRAYRMFLRKRSEINRIESQNG